MLKIVHKSTYIKLICDSFEEQLRLLEFCFEHKIAFTVKNATDLYGRRQQYVILYSEVHNPDKIVKLLREKFEVF